MLQYSEQEILDVIIWRREEFSWDKISQKFSKKYRHVSANALRKTYERYGNLHDITDEKILNDKLKELVRLKRSNSRLSRENRQVMQAKMEWDEILTAVESAASSITAPKLPKRKPAVPKTKDHMTIEAVLSDIHIGLRFKKYNLKTAEKRLKEFAQTLMDEYTRLSTLYTIDKVILAILGDLIESSTMHGMESSMACEFGNAEQVAHAIRLIFENFIVPLSTLPCPVYIPCVPGNHDRTEKARTFVHPGKHYQSHVVYHTLALMSQGYDNITFEITDSVYVVSQIYGNTILWEHGDVLKSNAQRSIDTLVQKRQRQIGKMIHFFRAGHLHEYLVYGRGRIVMNASVCGESSFSNVLGFNSVPSQTINTYVKTKDRPTCFYKSFSVFLP